MQVEPDASAIAGDVLLPSDTRSPVFIGGQRRSGTTLLRIMLNRHPHIACGRESHFAKRLLNWHDRLADEWSDTVLRYGSGPEAVDRAFAALVDVVFAGRRFARGWECLHEPCDARVLAIDANGPAAAPQHGPVFTTSIGRWRTGLSEMEVAAIQSVVGELMVELGYELAAIAPVPAEQAG